MPNDTMANAISERREAVHPVTRLLLYRIYHIPSLIANTTSRFPTIIFHSSLNTDLIGKSPIKIGTSETSFCNAAGGAGITSVFATLDSIHNRITGMESGFHNTTSAGPIFGILLQKSDSSGQGYSGLAFSYATMSIVYFAYIGGTFYIKIYG